MTVHGQLKAEILAKVAGYFESTVKLTKKVKSAMTYPIAVIGLAVALVNVLLIFVIPVFAAMFADFGAKLPAPTQFLINLSDFMKAYWWAIGIGCYAAWWGLNKFTATPNGRPLDPEPTPLPFADLRVVDFTAFWAGPFVTHWLATLGADQLTTTARRRSTSCRTCASYSGSGSEASPKSA